MQNSGGFTRARKKHLSYCILPYRIAIRVLKSAVAVHKRRALHCIALTTSPSSGRGHQKDSGGMCIDHSYQSSNRP